MQYLVLRDAETKPALLEWPDNVRILEAIEKSGLLSKEDTATLTNAYLEYRSRTHRLALQNQKGKVAGTIFTEERQAVRQIWHKILPDVNKS